MEVTARTLVEVLLQHAAERPNANAFTVLDNGELESGTCSFSELARQAERYAAWLLRNGLAGKSVVLLLRGPLEFIGAFLGCLYAGVVAVPMAVPRPNKSPATLRSVAENARPAAIVTTRADAQYMGPRFATSLPSATWLYLDDTDLVDRGSPAETSRGPVVLPGADDIAFIQYTSGSAGTPKGVMVTHHNLMCNEAAIQRAMGLSEGSRFAGWLPLFHDMGLIGNVLQPLYLGIPCVLMPPMAFLQRPIRWLNVIHKYRATISGAPNFAYDLCVERTTPEQRAPLDLSSWTVAFNGSEPVRSDTMERFAATFAAAGFRKSSFYPCYGLAESTLIVTGVAPGSEAVTEEIPAPSADLLAGADRGSAARHKTVVSCGKSVSGTEVLIVNPETRQVVADGTVGEIWVGGGSVSPGYYNSPIDQLTTFGASLLPQQTGPYLRTGDLGYVRCGHLFVTGRMKDLIIVRGCNHYPQDLEHTAGGSSPWLEVGSGAAFTLSQDGTSIVIVHEVTREGWRHADIYSVSADITAAISAEHGLHVGRVVLIKPGTLPRTSSGKVRRALCREMVKAGSFETLPDLSSRTGGLIGI